MKKEAIICVDDEIIILLSLIQELKQLLGNNYLYLKAVDGESALKLISDIQSKGISVVLIISDWKMPGLKGDELLERVRVLFPEIKSIMITGQASNEAIAGMRRNEKIISVLRKPWDKKDLQRALAGYY